MHVDVIGAVKQYRYRTAQVDDQFLSLPRAENRELEEMLAKEAGVPIDNHTVYEIVQAEGKPPVYILCHDSWMYFGLSVREGNW